MLMKEAGRQDKVEMDWKWHKSPLFLFEPCATEDSAFNYGFTETYL